MSDGDPHYHGHRQRLCERFLKSGLDGFADYEVVELLLTLAIPRSDVKQPAKALIVRFGNLGAILDDPIHELQAVGGIGFVTPVALKIIKAAATLYLQQSGEGWSAGEEHEVTALREFRTAGLAEVGDRNCVEHQRFCPWRATQRWCSDPTVGTRQGTPSHSRCLRDTDRAAAARRAQTYPSTRLRVHAR